MPLAIVTTKDKKTRKGDAMNLVMLALSGPMDAMVGYVKVIGGVELTNNLIVPWLVELHQVLKPHPLQVMDKLLNLWLRHLTQIISINILHVKDRRFPFLALSVAAVDQELIEVKVKVAPKAILNPQVLALFLIKVSST
jgi:hypothetical protein